MDGQLLKGLVKKCFQLQGLVVIGIVVGIVLIFIGCSTAQPIIAVHQAGFHELGLKQAVVIGTRIYTGGKFTLESGSGEVVLSKELEYWGGYEGLGHHWIADFSSVKDPGEYLIKVQFNETRASLPHKIIITDTAYAQLAGKAMIWFHFQRCGYEVEGWHKACHLDDGAIRVSSGENFGELLGYKDVSGGWHDAGDYNKWIAWGWQGIYALSSLWDVLQPQWEYLSDGNNMPDILKEAWWEGDYYIRALNTNGSLPRGVVTWQPDSVNKANDPYVYWGPPEEESDNTPESGDERLLQMEWPNERYMFLAHTGAAASLAKLAYVTQPFDEQKAEVAVEAVERLLNYIDTIPRNMRIHVDGIGGVVMANLYLAEVTGDDKFHVQAIDAIKEMFRLKERGFWEVPTTQWPDISQNGTVMHIAALLEFLDRVPDDMELDLQEVAKEEIRRFVDGIMVLTKHSPYGQASAYDFVSDHPDPVPIANSNSYYGSLSYILARSSLLFDDVELLHGAERQLQWIFGLNPQALSMAARIGWDYPKVYHTRYGTISGKQHAAVPGGIVVGMGIENGRLNKIAIDGRTGGHGPWQTNEYWITVQSFAILGATYIQKALAPDRVGSDFAFSPKAWADEVDM